MDGSIFISNLVKLEVPGAENLEENDYDCIFLDPRNESLVKFLQHFFDNNSLQDKLSDEELIEYERLASLGEVYSEGQLRQLELYFDSFPLEDEASSDINNEATACCEERAKRLEKQLLTSNKRKAIISLQNLEAKERLDKKTDSFQKQLEELEKRKAEINQTVLGHSKCLAKLVSTIDLVAADLILFGKKKGTKNVAYLSQVPLERWQKTEEEFTRALEAYVEKQFVEGIHTIAGQDDVTPYCILDAGNPDIQLVKGVGQPEYLRLCNELNRISKILECCEVDAAMEEAWKAYGEATLKSTSKIMEDIDEFDEDLPPEIESRNEDLYDIFRANLTDLAYKMSKLEFQVKVVAQFERMRVISDNYEMKLLRQTYFLTKQDTVMGFLLNQMSRFDFLKIALDIEKSNLSSSLQALVKLIGCLNHKNLRFVSRMMFLDQVVEKMKKYAAGELFGEGLTFMKLLMGTAYKTKEKYSWKDIFVMLKDLNGSMKAAETEANYVVEERMKYLTDLCKKCALLEQCLFGEPGRLHPLPASWMPEDKSDQMEALEQNVSYLYKEMLKVITDYQKKQKIMNADPDVSGSLLKWTDSFLKKS